MSPWLLPLGMVAGALTTLAGMGGGILLVLVLSLLIGPHEALAVTAPALLISNAHRLYLFRRHVDRRVAVAFAAGALPGSLLGGALVSWVSSGLVQKAMLLTTGLAVAQRVGWLKLRPPASLVGPAGFAVGAVSATSGGAGALVSPVLMAAGLAGDAYVAGTAAAGVAMHSGRVMAYGLSGMLSGSTAARSALLMVALLIGNGLGQWARSRSSARLLMAVELSTLIACAALAAAGVA